MHMGDHQKTLVRTTVVDIATAFPSISQKHLDFWRDELKVWAAYQVRSLGCRGLVFFVATVERQDNQAGNHRKESDECFADAQ